MLDKIMSKIPWLRAVMAEQDRRDQNESEQQQRTTEALRRSEKMVEEFKRAQRALHQ